MEGRHGNGRPVRSLSIAIREQEAMVARMTGKREDEDRGKNR